MVKQNAQCLFELILKRKVLLQAGANQTKKEFRTSLEGVKEAAREYHKDRCVKKQKRDGRAWVGYGMHLIDVAKDQEKD